MKPVKMWAVTHTAFRRGRFDGAFPTRREAWQWICAGDNAGDEYRRRELYRFGYRVVKVTVTLAPDMR